jgi:hypothetical protein
MIAVTTVKHVRCCPSGNLRRNLQKKKKIGNRPNCAEGRKQRNFLGHVSSEKRNIILIGERQVCLG